MKRRPIAFAASGVLAVATIVNAGDGPAIPVRAPAGGALVIVFYSTECPISNAYSPTLDALAHAFPGQPFRLIGLCTDPDRSRDALRRHAEEYGLHFPVHPDRDLVMSRKLGIRVTPEAVVLDDTGRVRYRGRIDDQFLGRRLRNARPHTRELSDAVAAVLAGREVECPDVPAVGCPLPDPGRR